MKELNLAKCQPTKCSLTLFITMEMQRNTLICTSHFEICACEVYFGAPPRAWRHYDTKVEMGGIISSPTLNGWHANDKHTTMDKGHHTWACIVANVHARFDLMICFISFILILIFPYLPLNLALMRENKMVKASEKYLIHWCEMY